jgi:hypothetical protein
MGLWIVERVEYRLEYLLDGVWISPGTILGDFGVAREVLEGYRDGSNSEWAARQEWRIVSRKIGAWEVVK